MNSSSFVEIRAITKHFGSLEILKGVSLTVQHGEMVSIVGASGAGKTTLLHIIGTLEQPTSGTVLINGQTPHDLSPREQARFRNQKLGFIFQFHELLPEFTAVENAAIPAMIKGLSRRNALREAAIWLERLGLSPRLEHKPHQLSGGEKQRVAVARALINRPDLLLADEPTGSLDSENKSELQHLLKELQTQYGQTILLVTHDTELARAADRQLLIVDGCIV